ncbi:MAG: hypothetical protein ACETVX_00235 [bacterium]
MLLNRVHSNLTKGLLIILSVTLLTTSVKAQEKTDTKYEPEKDIFSPGTSRWLYLFNMLYTAPSWSLLLNAGLGLEGRKATAVGLLATPATFFGFLLATRHRQINLGMVSLSLSGTWQGAGIGFMMGDLLWDWGQKESEFEPRALTAFAGSVAGNIVGFRHAESQTLNCGNAEMLSQAGFWGTIYAGFLTSLPIPWAGEYFSEDNGFPWRRKFVEVGTMFGWGAGLYLWYKKAPLNYTTGDAISSYNSTGLGLLTALAAYSLLPEDIRDIDDQDQWVTKATLLLPALVNAGGLSYGYWFHRNRDLNFSQSLLVTLGSILGASMIGSATALLLTPEYEAVDWRLSLTTAAIGGWVSFHLTHMLLDTGSSSKAHLNSNSPTRFVHLFPENAAALLLCAKTGNNCRLPLIVANF